jgi:Flp pilus assembly protein TadD
LQHIGGPALEFYQLVNEATYLQKNRRPEEAVAVWREALAMRPDDPTSHGGLGNSLLLAGRTEEAGPEIRKGAELKWRAALADNPGDFSAQRSLGNVLMESGDVKEAAVQLEKAVALKPSSAPAHCDLGVALMKLGNLDGAMAEEEKSLELDGRYAPAYYHLGVLMERKGDSSEAIREWQKTLETDPHYMEAHDQLAKVLYREGRVTEALAQWREGVNDAAALRQQAWILATSADPSIRNGKEALGLAVRAVELSHGKDAAIWDALGAAYAEVGQFDDAASTARRALAVAEQNGADEIEAIGNRLRLYEAGSAFRDAHPASDR